MISTAKQRFLVDIGISCRALTTRMKEIGVSVNELDGVFITHEHVDHVRGLATFLKNYQVPVYSSALTWRAILAKDSSLVRQNCRLIDNNRLLCGDLEVQSFSIPHDAADPARIYLYEPQQWFKVHISYGCGLCDRYHP